MKENKLKGTRVLAAPLAVLILFISIASSQPMAADFGVDDTFGYPDTFSEVPINIIYVQNESVAGIVFDISFDPGVIALNEESVQKGNLTSAWDLPSLNPANGRISIVFGGNGTEIPTGESGSVIILNFSVIGSHGAKSPINISKIQLSGLEGTLGTASSKNGTFTIEGITGAAEERNIEVTSSPTSKSNSDSTYPAITATPIKNSTYPAITATPVKNKRNITAMPTRAAKAQPSVTKAKQTIAAPAETIQEISGTEVKNRSPGFDITIMIGIISIIYMLRRMK